MISEQAWQTRNAAEDRAQAHHAAIVSGRAEAEAREIARRVEAGQIHFVRERGGLWAVAFDEEQGRIAFIAPRLYADFTTGVYVEVRAHDPFCAPAWEAYFEERRADKRMEAAA
jgi:hypothetical protein